MRKIRIKKEGGPLYQQNSNMSLNQGMVVEKEPTPSIRNVIEESDTPNTEVEKGEVVLKGDNSQMLRVNGKPHYMGGTKVELDPADFVFSHYLTPPEELKLMLGGSKKDKSFADLIKNHVSDYNQAIHDLNTSDDPYLKNAATFTAKGVMDKATKVAFTQEALKSFPQGVPAFIQNQEQNSEPVMKKGGMYRMQSGGPRKVNKSEYEEEVSKKIYNPIKDKPNYADRVVQNKTNENTNWKEFNTAYGNAQKGKGELRNRNGKTEFKFRNKWYDAELPQRDVIYYEDDSKKGTPVGFQKKELPGVVDRNLDRGVTPLKPSETTNDRNIVNQTGEEINTYTKPFTDSGYGTMDMVSMISPFLNPINRYAPIRQKVIAPQINPNLVDFTQQRQSVKGMTQTMSNQNNLISPSASIASSRNAQLLSQAINPIAESFANEFNTNQQIKTQADSFNKEMEFKAQGMNTELSDQYNTKYAQMNEGFDTEKRLRNREFLKNWYVADKRRQARNAFNYLNTDYQVGPNGEIGRIQYDEDRMMNRITGQSQGQSGRSISFDDWKKSRGKSIFGYDITSPEDDNKAWKLYLNESGLNDSYSSSDTDGDGKPNTTRRNSKNFISPFDFVTGY